MQESSSAAVRPALIYKLTICKKYCLLLYTRGRNEQPKQIMCFWTLRMDRISTCVTCILVLLAVRCNFGELLCINAPCTAHLFPYGARHVCIIKTKRTITHTSSYYACILNVFFLPSYIVWFVASCDHLSTITASCARPFKNTQTQPERSDTLAY